MLDKYIDFIEKKMLTEELSAKAFEEIMSGKSNDNDISLFLTTLQDNGVNENHILGAIKVMKSKMSPVDVPDNSIDTCGTGGDGKFSLNISTASAFVVAASGIPVAKHGNRSITSNCGSADVLKALSINISLNPDQLSECINKIGICFMFAPNHHSAMKHVSTVRQELGKKGIKTIFNILGPLLNPGSVKNQVIGVYSKEVQEIYKKVFLKLENTSSFIIHGFDGMDELSTEGSNIISSSKKEDFFFDPIDIFIQRPDINELIGKNENYNASRIVEVFSGKEDSFMDAIALNASLGIMLSKKIELNKKNIKYFFNESYQLIKDGSALRILKDLQNFTSEL